MTRKISVLAGLGLKAFALLAKFYFLLLIAPKLTDGTFSAYFTLSTAALLCARMTTGGLLEHLPTLIQGRLFQLNRFTATLRPLVIILLGIVGIGLFSGGELASAIAMSAAIALNNLVAGLKRTVAPWVFDFLANVPWLIFIAALATTNNYSAEFLLSAMAVSYSLVAMIILAPHLRRQSNFRVQRSHVGYLVAQWRNSHLKLISNLLQILQLRGAVVVAGLFWANKDAADELALALAVAEGAWQFFMVLNNRFYAEYCQAHVKPDLVGRRSIFFAVTFSVLAVITWVGIRSNLGWDWLVEPLWMGMLVAGMSLVWINIRYYLWSKGRDSLALASDAGSVALQGLLLLSPLSPLLCSALALAVIPPMIWRRARSAGYA